MSSSALPGKIRWNSRMVSRSSFRSNPQWWRCGIKCERQLYSEFRQYVCLLPIRIYTLHVHTESQKHHDISNQCIAVSRWIWKRTLTMCQAMVMSPGVELEENYRTKKGEKVLLKLLLKLFQISLQSAKFSEFSEFWRLRFLKSKQISHDKHVLVFSSFGL